MFFSNHFLVVNYSQKWKNGEIKVIDVMLECLFLYGFMKRSVENRHLNNNWIFIFKIRCPFKRLFFLSFSNYFCTAFTVNTAPFSTISLQKNQSQELIASIPLPWLECNFFFFNILSICCYPWMGADYWTIVR